MSEEVFLLIRLRDKKTEVILNAASVWESGGPTRSEGSRGMAWGRPETGTARTGCFDSVPSAASARDGTPLLKPCFVTQPDQQGNKLPVGLQLIGQPFQEARPLQIAHAYEQSTAWHKAAALL